jgi:hyperosmotically inducible protein
MKILTSFAKDGRALVILAVAISLTAIQGASAAKTRDQATTEQLLSENVRHALVTVPWYGVFDNLEYTMNGTEVVLSGQVVQPEGVTHVVDNITVLPLSRFDDQIRRAEFRSIFSEPSLGRYSMGAVPSIHIIVTNGHVTLDGVVIDQMDYNIAKIRALSVPGVFSVTNNLRIG